MDDLDDDVEAFMEHHGVKGMRWGVRSRYKAAVQNFGKVSEEVNARQTKRRNEATLTEARFKKLNNEDFVVKKGSNVVRVSKDSSKDIKNPSLYVSTNKQDAINYRATVPTWDRGHVPTRSQRGYYETTLQATKDLRSPSEKKRVEGYIKIMDQPSIVLNSGETISGKEYLSRQGLGSTIEKLSSRQVALTYYGQLVVNQGIKNEPLNTAYFNEMKSRGYNALIDDNDRGVFAATPLLVFNASENLKTVHVQKLTTRDVHDAQIAQRVPD